MTFYTTEKPLPTRQVHLDFHTSEHLPDVGSRFNKQAFQAAVKQGNLTSITVFAKCHHSWCYYPTTVGRVHPTLDFDLMGAQLEAAHEIGVECPLYITVGWSVNDAHWYPDSVCRNRNGERLSTKPIEGRPADEVIPPCCWYHLCPSGKYREHIIELTRELCTKYPIDGLFYDINNLVEHCYCPNCLAGMTQEGVDIDDEHAVYGYNMRKWSSLKEACCELAKAASPDATLYWNGKDKYLYDEGTYRFNTHAELEDLANAWGGYNKLPLRARFFKKQGRQVIAQSGKFNTLWGEFGGFKHPNALRYEVAHMLCNGVCAAMGDQLHPQGEMDVGTYERLGDAFGYAAAIEDYCLPSQHHATTGVWVVQDTEANQSGVVDMLLEGQIGFDAVTATDTLADYDVIILSGTRCLDDEDAARLRDYVAGGGGLLVLGESALHRSEDRLLIDIGAEFVRFAPHDVDYTRVRECWGSEMVSTPLLNYHAGMRVRPTEDAEVLADIHDPYFDRTFGHFCSHRNTPFQVEASGAPAILRKGRVVYFAHTLGQSYSEHAMALHRELVLHHLRALRRRTYLDVRLPSCGRAYLLKQEHQRRFVAHVLYAPPLPRGTAGHQQLIEDLPILHDVTVRLDVDEAIVAARLIPGDTSLPLTRENSTVLVTLPPFSMHQGVVFEYE